MDKVAVKTFMREFFKIHNILQYLSQYPIEYCNMIFLAISTPMKNNANHIGNSMQTYMSKYYLEQVRPIVRTQPIDHFFFQN
jgi:hypothetical protein